MPKRNPHDLEMYEAIATLLGLVAIALVVLFAGCALVAWCLEAA